MSDNNLSVRGALRLEYAIIALGIVALVMIFQPFSLTLFTIGAMIVVVAGLLNNLLPMAQPGVSTRSLVTTGMVVAMIFCITLVVAIFAASLYGVFFLKPPNPDTQAGKMQLAATPWYFHSFTLSVAAIAAVLAGLITIRSRGTK